MYVHMYVAYMSMSCMTCLYIHTYYRSLDVWKEFQEEAYSIAVHPSGLFILVGFSEKLRLMNILIDDIRVFKEISIRGCRECRFSNGGHLFAAANSNLIQIYSTYSFENVGNLKGHSGKVCVCIHLYTCIDNVYNYIYTYVRTSFVYFCMHNYLLSYVLVYNIIIVYLIHIRMYVGTYL